MSLSEEDRTLIRRLVDRQPPLILAGHEGYYPHEDIIAAIQLIGKLSAARKEAYQQGWNDREADLIAGVNRIKPEGWRLAPVAP